jgi:hypothetical protein
MSSATRVGSPTQRGSHAAGALYSFAYHASPRSLRTRRAARVRRFACRALDLGDHPVSWIAAEAHRARGAMRTARCVMSKNAPQARRTAEALLSPRVRGRPGCPTAWSLPCGQPEPKRASSGHRRRRIFPRVGRGAAGPLCLRRHHDTSGHLSHRARRGCAEGLADSRVVAFDAALAASAKATVVRRSFMRRRKCRAPELTGTQYPVPGTWYLVPGTRYPTRTRPARRAGSAAPT